MTSLLITGANRGIGFEFVRQYASEGARIFAACRNPAKADALRALADASGGKVTLHPLEVTDDDSINTLARELTGETIDILINNAGIKGDLHVFEPAGTELWDKVMRTNVIAPFRIAEAFRPHLEKGKRRIIFNISSGRGSHLRHRGDGIAYCASKAALNSAMYGLSVRLKQENFIIVMIAPGAVQTDMNPNAKLTATFSIGAMRKIIAGLAPADNGRYLDYKNRDVLW